MVNYYKFTMDCVKSSIDLKAPIIVKNLIFEVIKHTGKESLNSFSIWFEDDGKAHQCVTEEMSMDQLKELYKFLKITLGEDNV